MCIVEYVGMNMDTEDVFYSSGSAHSIVGRQSVRCDYPSCVVVVDRCSYGIEAPEDHIQQLLGPLREAHLQ